MKSKILHVIEAFMAVVMLTAFAVPVLAAPNEDAWKTVDARLVTNKSVSYAVLTDYCLNQWGLSENPYPEYPAIARPAYYVFTLQIGEEVFEGVSCNTQVYSVINGIMTGNSTAVWYLGKWGEQNAEMTNGFAGTVILQLPDYDPAKTPRYTYWLGTFDLEGFGRFNHQSLSLAGDSRISPLSSGTCTALGNRNKM